MERSEITKMAEALKQASAVLAGVCDGAFAKDGMGYNKPDSAFGHYIAQVPAMEWDLETVHVVSQMLVKYHEQLEGYGIDTGALPVIQNKWVREPTRRNVLVSLKDKAAKEKTTRMISDKSTPRQTLYDLKKFIVRYIDSGYVELFSPKNMSLVDDIKTIKPWQARRWEKNCWIITVEGYEILLGIIKKWNFFVTKQDLEAITHAAAKYAEELKAAEAAKKAAQRVAMVKPQVWLDGNTIVTKTPYNPSLVDVMKTIRGRAWSGSKGGPKDENTFPATVEGLTAVIKMALQFDLRVDPEVPAYLNLLEQKTRERVADSAALDADLEIEGFGNKTLQPFPFQRAGIKYAADTKRTFIADSMGLGKTLQALGTLKHTGSFPALIVVPAGVKLQWVREAKRWIDGCSVKHISGKNGAETYDDVDILVINYDIVAAHVEGLKAVAWKAIVLDESHYIKNRKAQRTEAVMALSELKSVAVRLCLTGTSVLNRPIELTQQLMFLGRLDEFGGFWNFATTYCDAHKSRYGWNMTGASNLEELSKKLRASCYIRREKADVVKELPELMRTVVPMELDDYTEYRAEAEAIYEWAEEVKRDAMESEDGNPGAAALAKIEKLKQLVVRHKLDSAISWIKDHIDANGKLVIFAHHRKVQDKLYKALKAYNPARIAGDDSQEARRAEISKFVEDDTCRVVVASLKAAGTGVDGLQKASSSVAFVEFAWTAAEMDQAESRLHRMGGMGAECINSYWLAADQTIDEDIIALIESKRAVIEAINAGQEIDATINVLDWLLSTRGESEEG